MLTFIRYIEVYFTSGLPDCVRYIEDFVTISFNTDSSHRALGEWTREKSLIFDTTNCVPIKLPNFCSGI